MPSFYIHFICHMDCLNYIVAWKRNSVLDKITKCRHFSFKVKGVILKHMMGNRN